MLRWTWERPGVFLLASIAAQVVVFVGFMIAFSGCSIQLPEELPEAEETETPTETGDNPVGPSDGVMTDVTITRGISHLPEEVRIDASCEDSGFAFDFSKDFLIGDLEDVWAADQLVGATIELETNFNADARTCVADGVRPMRTVVATIPQYLTVEEGNAGNSIYILVIGPTKCVYRGGSSVADPMHPFRANEALKGLQLHFDQCGDASAHPGSRVSGRFFGLYPHRRSNGDTLVVSAKVEVGYPIYSLDEIE